MALNCRGSRFGFWIVIGLFLTGCRSAPPPVFDRTLPSAAAAHSIDRRTEGTLAQTRRSFDRKERDIGKEVVTVAHEERAGVVQPAAKTSLASEPSEPVAVLPSSQIEQAEPIVQPIDLTTALLLTSGHNPQVQFARSRIEEALAQLDRANALKLPSIRAGTNYNKHEGRIQDVAGSIIETSRGSYYTGFGANAVGAGSPTVPGLISQFHFADAIFQPQIAQQTACARKANSLATTNDALLASALAYMDLLRSYQELSIAQEILAQAERLERVTGEFARSGEGLVADHDRARTESALRKNEVLRAEEQASITSARLAERIRWDAAQKLAPSELQLVPITLTQTDVAPRELVSLALAHRPELTESRHLVGEAIARLNRERNAPLVPSVLLAASYGGLGGGLGSDLGNFGDRLDADLVAYWELRQLGVGERAVCREARSRVEQARFRQLADLDRVAREVVEGHVQVTQRLKQIEIAEQAIRAAGDSHDHNWKRIENGQGLPIEALQSLQALATARFEYVRVIASYNSAQFTLHRAIGWPIYDALQ